jgi:hypothetical protein
MPVVVVLVVPSDHDRLKGVAPYKVMSTLGADTLLQYEPPPVMEKVGATLAVIVTLAVA